MTYNIDWFKHDKNTYSLNLGEYDVAIRQIDFGDGSFLWRVSCNRVGINEENMESDCLADAQVEAIEMVRDKWAYIKAVYQM